MATTYSWTDGSFCLLETIHFARDEGVLSSEYTVHIYLKCLALVVPESVNSFSEENCNQ